MPTLQPTTTPPRRSLAELAFALCFVLALVFGSTTAGAMRIKELASVQGVRSNALTGYGLVVGLDGTGDQTTQTPFTTQSLQAMLQQQAQLVQQG